MPQMKLFPAGAPELVRCNQKDRFYTDHLTSILSDISRQVLPLRVWLRWQRELQLLAEVGYYGLTTLIGNQTLGEEYCNIIQTGPPMAARSVAAGFFRRFLSVMLQTLGLYMVEKTLEVLQRRVEQRDLNLLQFNEREYELLEKVICFLEEVVTGVNQLHLALFYIHGLYYTLGKRLAGIKYLMIRYGSSQVDTISPLITYRVLGWLVLLQLTIQMVKCCYKAVKRKREGGRQVGSEPSGVGEGGMKFVQEAAVMDGPSQFKCPLCLELCSNQTTTLCGHVYCWVCISEWTSEKSECPVCRNQVQPQQLVPLQYFTV